jgi:hypothetical protein
MRRRDEQQHPFDLLSEFIHLRKNGVNRDEAWFQVCDENPNMHSATRQAFANLAHAPGIRQSSQEVGASDRLSVSPSRPAQRRRDDQPQAV